jgi:hypothetical protein
MAAPRYPIAFSVPICGPRWNLTTQAAQVACFRNVAAHLEPGGCFVIEVMIPDLRKLPAGQNVVPLGVSPTAWAFDLYDIATQTMSSNYVQVIDGHGEYNSNSFRYVWPAELDLMAQLAGLRLRERWNGWTREPFTSESRQHVSIWEKPTSLNIGQSRGNLWIANRLLCSTTIFLFS